MCRLVSAAFLLLATTASAQFHVGVSAGAFDRTLTQQDGGIGFGGEDKAVPLSASVWYRERPDRGVGIGVEVQWTHHDVTLQYFNGGLGGGTNYDLGTKLDMLHLTLAPEFRLGPSGHVYLRLGPQIGLLASGRIDGTARSWGHNDPQGVVKDVSGPANTMFRADPRLMMGFGFETGLNRNWVLSLDPYFSQGIGSINKADPVIRTMDLGMKLSFARRFTGCSLIQRIRMGSPSGK